MKRLGIITGVTREADCLTIFPADRRPLIRCSGANSDRAYAAASELIADGCQGLLSFGMAGGLSADLKPGAVIVADQVITADGRSFETSKPWRERLMKAIGGNETILVAAVAGRDRVVASAAAKRALGAEQSAVAVDMESHAAALAAAEADVPFLVVRVVADPVTRNMPEWVIAGVAEDGSIRYGRMISAVLGKPWDLPALIGLAGDSAKAIASLRRVAGLAGPLFRLG